MSNNRVQVYENVALDAYVPGVDGYKPSWGGGQTENAFMYRMAIEQLSAPERDILIASFHLTSEQMAEMFGKKPATLRKQIERLKKAIHCAVEVMKTKKKNGVEWWYLRPS
jgi:DNA-binding CsgD family transcriptional regulator